MLRLLRHPSLGISSQRRRTVALGAVIKRLLAGVKLSFFPCQALSASSCNARPYEKLSFHGFGPSSLIDRAQVLCGNEVTLAAG